MADSGIVWGVAIGRSRRYKEAFGGVDVESPAGLSRKDLSKEQRGWLTRAWKHAAVSLLGMEKPVIPDAIFRYNEERGVIYVPAIKPVWHHVVPFSEMARLDGLAVVNNPRLIVPLSDVYHSGRGILPGEEEELYVVHPDELDAKREWAAHIRAGADAVSPFTYMVRERGRRLDRGEPIHDPAWDKHFAELAERVVWAYHLAAKGGDRWPEDR